MSFKNLTIRFSAQTSRLSVIRHLRLGFSFIFLHPSRILTCSERWDEHKLLSCVSPAKLFDAVEMEGWSRRGHLSSEGFFFVNNRSRTLDVYLMELCAASVSRTVRGFRNCNYRPSSLQPVVSFKPVCMYVFVCLCVSLCVFEWFVQISHFI